MTPATVPDLTVNVATPLLVFCGDAVSSVVLAVPVVLLKPTENEPWFARFLFASVRLTVALEVDEPSFAMDDGENAQATCDGPPAVKTTVAVVDVTVAPSLKVTVQPDVANVEVKTNRA